MLINKLALKKKTNSSLTLSNSQVASNEKTDTLATDRNMKLNNFINDFIISNIYNVFKVVYLKDCNTIESWRENVSSNLSALLRNLYLKFDVEVITYEYSNTEQRYIPKTHILQNIEGFEVANTCFNNIKEVSYCDMLVIRMSASVDLNPYLTIPGQNPRYKCCYLFARR